MDQNKIYKNKHPSDFTSGSIIKNINNPDKSYLYIVPDIDGTSRNIYAVGLTEELNGNTWTSQTRVDWELIRGSLKE